MILAGAHAGAVVQARFRAEAEAIARLRHSDIVQIYHVGEVEGLPYLELEYLPGGGLDQALNGSPKPPAIAASLVEIMARAIAEAHHLGIVHRDLKPANVLLDQNGRPKVADFGLAKILGSDGGLTKTSAVLGSPSYMAPEQAEGERQQRRAEDRRLLTGSDPLRAVDGPPAVPRGDGPRDPGAREGSRPGAAVENPAGLAGGDRDDLSEVPREATGEAIRDGV